MYVCMYLSKYVYVCTQFNNYYEFNNYLINIFLFCWTKPVFINLQQNDYLYKPPLDPLEGAHCTSFRISNFRPGVQNLSGS